MSPGRLFILETGLVSILFLAPLFFGAVPLFSLMGLCAALFFLLFCFPQALFEIRNLPRPFPAGLTLVFVVIIIQTFFTSWNHYASGIEGVKWLAFAVLFLLVQLLPKESVVHLMVAVILIGLLEVIYGLFQVWTGHEMVLWQKKEFHLGFVSGTYLNRNHFAGLLELSLGVSFGFWLEAFRQKSTLKTFGWGLAIMLMLTGFVQSGSRMGNASLFLSLFILSASFFGKGRNGSRAFFFFAFFFLAVAVIANRHTFFLRIEDLNQNWFYWDEARIIAWKNALQVVRDYPWFGIGLGSFEWVFPAYQSEQLYMYWAHLHQDYLELLVSLGIPGFVFLFLAFAGFAWRFLRNFPAFESFAFPFVWGNSVSILSFLLHGFTDFNLAVPANNLVFVLLLAVSYRLLTLSRGEDIHYEKA